MAKLENATITTITVSSTQVHNTLKRLHFLHVPQYQLGCKKRTSKITLAANIDKMNWIALLPSEVILVETLTGDMKNPKLLLLKQ